VVSVHYREWPSLDQLCSFRPTLGILENRKDALVSIDREPLEMRMRKYLDPNFSWESLETLKSGFTQNAARFDAKKTRARLLAEANFDVLAIKRVSMRPMDRRWCYYSQIRPLWNEPRPTYVYQCLQGNASFVSRRKGVADPEGVPFFFTKAIGMQHAMHTDAYYFPLVLRAPERPKAKKKDDSNGELGSILQEAAPAYEAVAKKVTANLSPAARTYLAKLGITNPDNDAETAALIWMHALAIGYSPAYLAENAGGIRQDWPRIPLPELKTVLLASAELGKQIAALLDISTPVTGVDSGKVCPELVKIAVVTRLTKEALNLSLTAGWGHLGKGDVKMPGKGKLETRSYTAEESSAAVPAAPGAAGGTPALPLLGSATHDIFLNESAGWCNVPEKVWTYTIGGYQVIKKWLSYREQDLLGRPLTPDEAREVTHMARRIAALILLQPELDKNYQAVKAATVVWKP
jgi:hypothetical protein